MATHYEHITNDVAIDSRTVRRLDAQVPDADTQDRTDGRVGWSYYGIDRHGNAWTWSVYNGNPEPHYGSYLADLDDEDMIEHIQAVADEISAWDQDHAGWLRGELDAVE